MYWVAKQLYQNWLCNIDIGEKEKQIDGLGDGARDSHDDGSLKLYVETLNFQTKCII